MTERQTSAGFEARLWEALGAPKDIAAIVAFRVALGLTVSVSALRFLAYGWIGTLLTQSRLHLSYWGFGWIPFPSPQVVYGLFVAWVVLGLCVAAGFVYRWSVGLLWLSFTWVQLLDVSNYLNHYYLVSLFAALMLVIPAHRSFSVDAWRAPSLRSQTLPAWCTYLLRFQVGTVYFFAGLAKLNGDWLLHAQPLSIWLTARTDVPLVGPHLQERWVAYLAAWAGFLFDTTVTGFLLWRRTRPFAYAALLVFHAATAVLFPIGMFPVIMSVAAWAFFEPSWPRRIFHLKAPDLPPAILGSRPWSRVGLALAALYVFVQWAAPLRAHLYGGNVSWHEQGMRFSWRVMTREKNGSVTYIVRDPATGQEWHVSPRKFLSSLQERELSVQPDLILQLAHVIAQDFKARGKPGVQVFVEAQASLNGRPAKRLISPTVDLAREQDGLGPKGWITEAPGPLQ